jgi:hypothetical protein
MPAARMRPTRWFLKLKESRNNNQVPIIKNYILASGLKTLATTLFVPASGIKATREIG